MAATGRMLVLLAVTPEEMGAVEKMLRRGGREV